MRCWPPRPPGPPNIYDISWFEYIWLNDNLNCFMLVRYFALKSLDTDLHFRLTHVWSKPAAAAACPGGIQTFLYNSFSNQLLSLAANGRVLVSRWASQPNIFQQSLLISVPMPKTEWHWVCVCVGGRLTKSISWFAFFAPSTFTNILKAWIFLNKGFHKRGLEVLLFGKIPT